MILNGYIGCSEINSKYNFTKADLKTGMTVEARNRNRYLVLRDYDTANYGNQQFIISRNGYFMTGNDYMDNLLAFPRYGATYDIMKVYVPQNDSYILNMENCRLIWER